MTTQAIENGQTALINKQLFAARIFDLTSRSSCVTFFLIVALPTLVILCLILAPFQGLDEPSHFYRAVQISEGRVLPVRSADSQAAGDKLDSHVFEVANYYYKLHFYRWKLPFGEAPQDRSAAWKVKQSGDKVFVDFSNTVIYFPLAYAAPATTIAGLRALGAPPLAWLYGARLVDISLATLIFVAAIWLFPEGRVFVFLFALLPRTLLGTASLSADSLLLPFAALFAAMIARLATDGRLTRIGYSLLIVSGFYICTTKIAYIPLIIVPPLIALLARPCARRPAFILSVAGAVTVAVWAAWAKVISRDVFPIRFNVHIDVYRQLAHVVIHPLHGISVFTRTLLKDGVGYADTAVGGELNSTQTRVPYPLVGANLLLLVITAFCAAARSRLKLVHLALTVFVAMSGGFAVLLLLYMQYTGLDNPVVEGVQGRYFLPLLPVCVVFLPKIRFSGRLQLIISATTLACVLLNSGETLHLMKLRYMDTPPVSGVRFVPTAS